MKKFKFIFSTLLLLLFSTQSQATVRAYLNQNTVYEGDPVTLTLEVDSNSAASPDLSVLKSSFRILSTSTSSSVQFINGVSTSSKRWIVQLQPQKMGQLEIPAIALGAEKSEPITLNVTDTPPDVKAKQRETAMLEASTGDSEKAVYVQQQIPYTLKLYTDDNVMSGELFPPEIDHAVIEQLSKDKQYRVTKNGKAYNVLERHYVISPEHSGLLTIPPARFKGTQKAPSQHPQSRFFARDGFLNDTFGNDFFSGTPFGNPGKPIQTSSASISINVQPVAADYHGKNWLPAESLELTDSWAEKAPEFRVGEPAVRHLKLKAKGLSGSQIPDIPLDKPAKIRLYPDHKESETLTDGKTIYGVSEQNITYIPDQAGKTTLPAISIDWWNTQTGKQETLTLAEKTIDILAGEADTNIAPLQSASTTEKNNLLPAGKEPAAATVKQDAPPINSNKTPWLVAGVLGFLLLLSLLWNFRKKPGIIAPTSQPRSPEAPVVANKKHIRQALRQACEQNDAATAAKQLLKLAQAQWPTAPPQNLGALADRVTSGSEEIRQLDRALYAASIADWQGKNLWQAIQNGLQTHPTNDPENTHELGNLYPH